MLLNPHEVSIVQDPTVLTGGSNARALAIVRSKLNVLTGDLELTSSQIDLVRAAERNWQGGYQRQFQAVLQALHRHP